MKLTSYGWFRSLIWQPIYEFLASRFQEHSWHFMNYGFNPNENEPKLILSEEDEIHRYSLQMYHYLATKTEIKDKTILEIGSGRGGGSKYIATHLKPKKMTGMDVASEAVDFSNRIHKYPNLNFIQGNAEDIPLADNSIDVVINVESSHAYGSVDLFLKEVRRVLKPGGKLLLVDLRNQPRMEHLLTQIKNSGFQINEETDITENVIQAIINDNDLKWKRITTSLPKNLRKLLGEFAGVVDSRIYNYFKQKKHLYYKFVLSNSTDMSIK